MENANAREHELCDTTDSEDDTADDNSCKDGDSESLSDIDDLEVGSYLIGEKEKHYKKIIWDLMNQKYLKEQEAKKFAAASNVTNSKRELRHKKATGVKKTQSVGGHPTLPEKRPSSRINYSALSEILNDHSPSGSPKKRRNCLESDNVVGESSIGTLVNDTTSETKDKQNDWEDDANYSHYNNQDKEYDFNDDDDFF
ncbi:Transcription factor IIIB 90 kDa subunit [Bienertia sinuspersici]